MSGLIGGLSPGIITGAQQALGIAAGPLAQLTGGLGQIGELAAVLRMGRALGTIIPDVTIEETHSDHMEVTRHPIANNSPISDHAYRHPAEITMRLGWTNANPLGGLIESATSLITTGTFVNPLNSVTETRARDVYRGLQRLQQGDGTNPPTPFTLSTGKRLYKKVVISELSVQTDRHSEYALMVTCHMIEVILVDTQTTSVPAANQQALAQTTNPTAEQGPQQRRSMMDRLREGVGIKETPGGWVPPWVGP